MGIGIDDDLQLGQAVFLAGIDGDEDAEEVADFVGNFLQQSRGIRQPDDLALVVAPDVQFAAPGIREAAGPAQELQTSLSDLKPGGTTSRFDSLGFGGKIRRTGTAGG